MYSCYTPSRFRQVGADGPEALWRPQPQRVALQLGLLGIQARRNSAEYGRAQQEEMQGPMAGVYAGRNRGRARPSTAPRGSPHAQPLRCTAAHSCRQCL